MDLGKIQEMFPDIKIQLMTDKLLGHKIILTKGKLRRSIAFNELEMENLIYKETKEVEIIEACKELKEYKPSV